MTYDGPERRLNSVLVTENSEYHVRSGVCVAVRSLRHGDLTREHPAVGSRVLGGFSFCESSGYNAHYGLPEQGEKICFENDLLTSPLRSVRRPQINVVELYESIS